MKISSVILLFFILGILFLFLSNSNGRANNSDAGNTGAPCEDGLVCRDCHFGGNFGPVTESFKLFDIDSGLEEMFYIPGNLYNAEIKVVPSGIASRFGFQATALSVDSSNAGHWLLKNNNVQISAASIICNSGTRTYIEHTIPFFLPTFKMDWQAPSCDIGPITFYFIGNAVNNDGSTSGDVGGTGSSRTYSSNLPEYVVIDSSNITSGTYLARDFISVKGILKDSQEISLGAMDSIIFLSQFVIESGSQVSAFNDNCIVQ